MAHGSLGGHDENQGCVWGVGGGGCCGMRAFAHPIIFPIFLIKEGEKIAKFSSALINNIGRMVVFRYSNSFGYPMMRCSESYN